MGRAAAAARSAARRGPRRIEGRADQVRLRLARAKRPRPHGTEGDPRVRHPAGRIDREPRGHAHDRDRAAPLQAKLVPGLPAAGRDTTTWRISSPGRAAVRRGPEKEGVERDRPLAVGPGEDDRGVERQQRDHQVGAGARVGEVAAHRRLVPREEVGEVPGGAAEGGQAGLDERRGEQLAHRHPASDPRDAVVRGDRLQLRQIGDVHQHRRLAPALAEVDQEVRPPGQGLRRRVLREERRRLEERGRVEVLEARQEHR